MDDVDNTINSPRRGMLLTLAGLSAIRAQGTKKAGNFPPATEDWLDVRGFGARCDGRSDDAAAVEATINAALVNPLPPPIAIPGVCYLNRSVRVRRPVDTTKAVLRFVGAGPGAGFKTARAHPMFVGEASKDGSPGTEFLRFEAIRFDGSGASTGPVMNGDFLRITFAFCEFLGIACLLSDQYAQEWRFIGCLARGWRGPFFSSAGGYGVTSSNSKYQFGGAAFKLVDPTLRKSGCVGCSFVQDIYEGSVGPFLEFELGKGVSVSNLYAEDIEKSTIVIGSRARSEGISVNGSFFGTRPDNVKSSLFAEIVWNNVSGAVSIGNVATGRLHNRDDRTAGFVSLGDHDATTA